MTQLAHLVGKLISWGGSQTNFLSKNTWKLYCLKHKKCYKSNFTLLDKSSGLNRLKMLQIVWNILKFWNLKFI